LANEARACWLSGNSKERKEVLAKIKTQFAGNEVQVFDTDVSYAYFEQQVLTSSCFSQKRLIIVKGLPIPSSTKPTMINNFKKLIDSLPDDVFVVFDGIDAGDEKALSGHISKVGKLFDFPSKLEPRDAPNWLMKEIAEGGKAIEYDDAQFLVQTSGYDSNVKGIGIDVLRIAAKKLMTYVGSRRKNITKDDIIATSFPSEEFVVWRIFEAFDSKNIDKCMEAMHRMIMDEDDVAGAVFKLFNLAQVRFRLLLLLKEGLAKNLSKADVAKEAASFQKLSQTGSNFQMKMVPAVNETGENKGNPQSAFTEFAINSTLNGAFGKKAAIEIYNRKELYRIVTTIQECLGELRYRSTSDAFLLLMSDLLLFAICGKLDDSDIAKLRKPADD
jgi:DNA polymerase III delta subunit